MTRGYQAADAAGLQARAHVSVLHSHMSLLQDAIHPLNSEPTSSMLLVRDLAFADVLTQCLTRLQTISRIMHLSKRLCNCSTPLIIDFSLSFVILNFVHS